METGSEDDLVDRAVALAERLLMESHNIATRRERRQLARLGRLIDDERGREREKSRDHGATGSAQRLVSENLKAGNSSFQYSPSNW